MSSAPYVSAADLIQRPLGVSWASIGKTAATNPAPNQNTAALDQICRVAANQVDSEVGQTLRTLFVTEVIRGPSHRIGFLPGNDTARVLTSWSPIRKVLGGAVAATSQVPKMWTAIPAGFIYQQSPPVGFYGTNTPEPYHGGLNALLVSSTYMNWGLGRYGIDLHATYLNGWPHAVLTAGCSEGISTLQVDDVTGFVQAAPWVNDGTDAEQVTVIDAVGAAPTAWSPAVVYTAGVTVTYGGTVFQAMIPSGPNTQAGPQMPAVGAFWSTTIEPAGPGILTLSAGTGFPHPAGTVVTAVPEVAIWAACLFAKSQALQRGLATVSIKGEDGKALSTDAVIEAAIKEAVASLVPFRRVT